MKKQMSWFILAAAVLGLNPAVAATNSGTRAASSVDFSSQPATRARTNVNYQKYQTRTTTRTYNSNDGKNLYYTQPVNRSALYKQYDSGRTSQTTTVRTSRAETLRTELKRKYYLAHPFFQPLGGKFGSVTDLSYTDNSYKINLTPVTGFSISDPKATWSTKQFSVKEDFSYGITDRIAVLGMLRYDSAKYKFDWTTAPDDEMDDNDLNMFGLGGQWRFVDNDKWIATASAYYQHQKDISDNVILDIKAGYKVARSTIYGLARGWYVDFDGNSYGNGIEGKNESGHEQSLFLAYKTDVSNAFYFEGGLGVFSVLDEDWTFNLEGIFGTYDWHNQASLKAALGWQPTDWVALNLYAKMAVYDSADDKKLDYYVYGAETSAGVYQDSWVKHGTADVNDYKETTVGLQAIFQF